MIQNSALEAFKKKRTNLKNIFEYSWLSGTYQFTEIEDFLLKEFNRSEGRVIRLLIRLMQSEGITGVQTKVKVG